MERLGKREWWGLAVLFCLLAIAFSFLPLRGYVRYLSPDETAVAVSALHWAKTGSAALSEPLAWKFPSLHPRSYVSHYDAIVPVGFLGWPFVASLLIRVVGQNWLPLALMLVILSGIYPLYRLLRPLGQNAALLGTLVAFSSPALILYANRPLFPNAGLIALALWTCLLLREMKRDWQNFLAGVLVCLTLAIRPVELFWLLPWLVYFGRNWKPTRNQIIFFGLGALLAFIPLAWQANVLYGNVFQAGYLVQGNPDPNPLVTLPLSTRGDGGDTGVGVLLPFGLHPTYIGWNVFKFLSGALFPWMVPLVIAAVLAVYQKKRHALLWLSLWTLTFLILYYGNGRYADNITGAVTIGNSFVRYLMPLGILSGAAFAWLYAVSEKNSRARILTFIMAAVLVFAGIFQAFFADNEGLWSVQNDPARYEAINKATQEMYPQGAIVISERSDKIFFPEFQAWSPPPDPILVNKLSQNTETPILLFTRPMSQVQKDAWSEVGVVPIERYSNAREILYELQYVQ